MYNKCNKNFFYEELTDNLQNKYIAPLKINRTD